MEQGDIILVRYPFSNLVDYKIRPAVIVSSSEFNRKFDNWICPITSKKLEQCIPLTDSISEGKLEKESFAKANTIAVIEEDLILKKIGKINKEKTSEIITQIIKNLKT